MKYVAVLSLLFTLTVATPSANAIEDLVESVATGCATELENFCADVTPGEGRILSCLYAYEDKLSGQCEYAMYDAAAQLERFVAALSYLANECSEDLMEHCEQVSAGEGRIASCLLDNKDKLQPRCATAIDEVELEVVE